MPPPTYGSQIDLGVEIDRREHVDERWGAEQRPAARSAKTAARVVAHGGVHAPTFIQEEPRAPAKTARANACRAAEPESMLALARIRRCAGFSRSALLACSARSNEIHTLRGRIPGIGQRLR